MTNYETRGTILLRLAQGINIEGKQVNGLRVDLETKEIIPEYEGLPQGEKIPLIPQASTTEYIILCRNDQGNLEQQASFKATF